MCKLSIVSRREQKNLFMCFISELSKSQLLPSPFKTYAGKTGFYMSLCLQGLGLVVHVNVGNKELSL
uniref:Uncharacterized protein n=1 Tax=Nelumbo nucifera TaxID=4432 RepID=A0A822YT17_NELNU|nr:TPA_asm: hypothetical protein HUJ06_005883 [Nelumbo nucifera]